MAIIKIDGQNIPMEDEVAKDDSRVKMALAQFYPDAANARITRTTENGQMVVSIVKQAGTKGALAPASAPAAASSQQLAFEILKIDASKLTEEEATKLFAHPLVFTEKQRQGAMDIARVSNLNPIFNFACDLQSVVAEAGGLEYINPNEEIALALHDLAKKYVDNSAARRELIKRTINNLVALMPEKESSAAIGSDFAASATAQEQEQEQRQATRIIPFGF
jgi:hypothetical protein